MQQFFAACALCAAMTTTAYAGGLDEPVMEPEAIAEATSSASHDIIVPLLFLVLLAAAVTAD